MQQILLLALALSSSFAVAAPRKKVRKPVPVVDEAPAPTPPTEIKWNFGAQLDLQGQYFPSAVSPLVNQTFGIANGEVSSTVKVGDSFLAKFRPTAHWDPLNPSPADQSWYDVPEGYMQLKTNLSESTVGTLQVGWNTFSWGVTDGYNPIDVVNARRYNDPLYSEKLGAFSALGRVDVGWLLLEGLFIPWQRQATLPGGQSRWLPRELGGSIQQGSVTFDPPAAPDYYYLVPKSYDSSLHNNFGGRVSTHVLGIDAAGYYFDGAATVPALGLALSGTPVRVDPVTGLPLEIAANSQIGLRPIDYRVKVKGASAVFQVWELLVRGEVAITDGYESNNASLLQHDSEAVAELEHTFSGEKSTFTLIGLVSWADPQYGGNDPNATSTNTPSLIALFDNAAGLGMRWSPVEVVSAETFAVADVRHGGSLYRANVSYKLSEAWKVYGGGEVFMGQINQPIGVYRKNSRAIAGLHLAL